MTSLASCGVLERTDFYSFYFAESVLCQSEKTTKCVFLERTRFLLLEGVVVIKELILNSFYTETTWWS